jgi:hypothetical protein
MRRGIDSVGCQARISGGAFLVKSAQPRDYMSPLSRNTRPIRVRKSDDRERLGLRGNCNDRLPMMRLVNLRPAPCQLKEIRTASEPRTYGLRRVRIERQSRGPCFAARSSAANRGCGRAQEHDLSVVRWRGACHWRGSLRKPRRDPGAVSGDRHTPAQICLPSLRSCGSASGRARSAGRRRAADRAGRRYCGLEICRSLPVLPAGAEFWSGMGSRSTVPHWPFGWAMLGPC